MATTDHGADGVHHAHAVLLQVRVRLHVAKVLCLQTGVGGKEAEKETLLHSDFRARVVVKLMIFSYSLIKQIQSMPLEVLPDQVPRL